MALVLFLVTLGAALQGVAGFGMGLIAAPPLMLIAPEFVPGPLMASGTLLTGLVAYQGRASIDFRGVGHALLGRIVGTALAATFLAFASPRFFSLAFGSLVLLSVALSVSGLRLRLTPVSAGSAGLLSGLMGTISSIGGPPMALLYQHASAARLRSTLAIYFVLGVGFSLAALHLVGRFGWEQFEMALFLCPAMLAGFVLARPLQSRLPEAMVRPLVLGASLMLALGVIGRAL
ncbi:MAG: sulfite exporter TauE/SafE family protein [Myxococcota bacterium]|nr:sulfite exporter TauE/SafE family protein [Myxococcota bacterium]